MNNRYTYVYYLYDAISQYYLIYNFNMRYVEYVLYHKLM